MTSFDDRKTAFESKFAHDEETRFKAVARRNRLVGLWAAGLLGRSGAEADAYAAEVVRADFQEAGDEDVVRKLVADLGDRADVAAIREQLSQALLQAQGELMGRAG